MPPTGWKRVTSTTGSGTTVTNDASAAYSGTRGMLCIDDSTTETRTQRTGIEFTLQPGRFEWIAEGWFNPTVLDLAPDQSIVLLHFLHGENLSVAARIRNEDGQLLAGIVAKDSNGDLRGSSSSVISGAIVSGFWRKWRLHLLRIGTRETTAVLYLDKDGELAEHDRLNWDSTTFEPQVLRAGIGRSEVGGKATILVDELRISEYPIP